MQETILIPREIREILRRQFSRTRFLSDEEQGLYEQECKRFKGKAKETLQIPKHGSNLFKILFLNQIGIQTATLPELELALENEMDLKKCYEDGREVILRSIGDNSYKENDYLAKSLFELIRRRKFNNPFIIKGLEVIEDDNSAYGLSFKPADDFSFFEAPDFSHKNNQRNFLRINEDYSIDFADENQTSSRILYTREGGLSGLNLYRYLDLNSYWDNLAYSDSDGRVVVLNKTSEGGS